MDIYIYNLKNKDAYYHISDHFKNDIFIHYDNYNIYHAIKRYPEYNVFNFLKDVYILIEFKNII